MESKDIYRIYNKGVFLSLASGGEQFRDVRIDVPFPVKKIVFHPPVVQVDIAEVKAETYAVSTGLNPDGGGVVGFFVGGTVAETVPQYSNMGKVTVLMSDPKQISGFHKFTVRGFGEITGGVAVPISADIAIMIEFHSC